MPAARDRAFGDLLRGYRHAAGLSQEGLAERAGLSPRGISDLERGINRRPQRETVALLVAALALAPEERAAFETVAYHLAPATRTTRTTVTMAAGWPSTLPVPPTPLLGRDQERVMVRDMLCHEDVRLLTLIGPGGVGKTRLGLQVAADLAPRFADGVTFVPLAPLAEPRLFAHALAGSLGLTPGNGRPWSDRVAEHLRDKQVLLVLDNMEHLLAAAPDIAALLAGCARLTVLATSRAALRVRGEREMAVAPLVLPHPDPQLPLDALAAAPAVALFVARAQDSVPGFQLTPANAAAIAAISRRLDGLPLAIELAAGQLKLFPPRALLARLDTRLRVLIGGARDLPERQQTMRATIAWSYDLLRAGEQTMFRRLSVFVGGGSVEAVQVVCRADAAPPTEGLPAAEGDADVLDWLGGLLDKSLVHVQREGATLNEEEEDGERRFGVLETIREYGQEQLAAHGEAASTRYRHAMHYLALAERAARQRRGSQQLAWLARLEQEHNNVRAALRWARENGETQTGLQLAGAICWFWLVRGHLAEGRAWLEGFLAASAGTAAGGRVKALEGAASLALQQRDYRQAAAWYEESLALYRGAGDHARLAAVGTMLAEALTALGDYDRAHTLCEEALVLWHVAGDGHGRATALGHLAMVAQRRHDHLRATALYEESLAVYRDLNDTWSVAVILNELGELARHRGRAGRARAAALFEQSLGLRRELGHTQGIAATLGNLGRLACDSADSALARQLLGQSLSLFRSLGDVIGLAWCLEAVARVTRLHGSPEQATRFSGAALAIRESTGVSPTPDEQGEIDRDVRTARTALGEQAFTRAYVAGQTLTVEQAVAVALEACSVA